MQYIWESTNDWGVCSVNTQFVEWIDVEDHYSAEKYKYQQKKQATGYC